MFDHRPVHEPRPHQRDGIIHLLTHARAALFDAPGTGKSKQIIDTSDILYRRGRLAVLVVVCPASARSVWEDPKNGEIAKHSTSRWVIHSIARKCRYAGPEHSPLDEPAYCHGDRPLDIVVISYSMMRSLKYRTQVQKVMESHKGETWLVCDESHNCKAPRAQQTRETTRFARHFDRVTIMTGSPCDNAPIDLYCQFGILDKRIMGYRSWSEFRERHAIMTGYWNRIIGWRDLDSVHESIAPYTLQRNEDVLAGDGPPEPVIQVQPLALDDKSWNLYCQMRDTLVMELDAKMDPSYSEGMQDMEGEKEPEYVTAMSALTGAIRLSQLAAGYVSREDGHEQVNEIKLNAAVQWVRDMGWSRNLEQIKPKRLLIWTRFRHELVLLADRLSSDYEVLVIRGGQTPKQREDATNLFNGPLGDKPRVCVANAQAGGTGLNLQSCDRVLYVSQDYSLTTATQSFARTWRQGQTNSVHYTYLVTTAPDGSATIDGAIRSALADKRDLRHESLAGLAAAIRGV